MADDISDSLRLRYGLSPQEPTDAQIRQIAAVLRRLGRKPTESDLENAVEQVCPSFGSHKYAGLDLSDVGDLLQDIIDQA